MFQCNPICNSCFLCGAFCQIEHREGCVEQSNVNTKPRDTNSQGTCTAPEIQSVQSLGGFRKSFPQIGKGQINTQSALGSFQVGSVFFRSPLKSFGVGIAGHKGIDAHGPGSSCRPGVEIDAQGVNRP